MLLRSSPLFVLCSQIVESTSLFLLDLFAFFQTNQLALLIYQRVVYLCPVAREGENRVRILLHSSIALPPHRPSQNELRTSPLTLLAYAPCHWFFESLVRAVLHPVFETSQLVLATPTSLWWREIRRPTGFLWLRSCIEKREFNTLRGNTPASRWDIVYQVERPPKARCIWAWPMLLRSIFGGGGGPIQSCNSSSEKYFLGVVGYNSRYNLYNSSKNLCLVPSL